MQDRIKNIRELLGLKQTEFAKKLDVPNSTIHKYENGVVEPSSKFLSKIAKKFNINMNWLLTGEGQMFLNDSSSDDNIVNIPFYTEVKAAAGCGAFVNDEYSKDFIPFNKNYIKNILNADPKNLSVICVSGDSMYPTLFNGDIVLVDHSRTNYKQAGIYVIRFDDTIVIKRIQPLPISKLEIKSDNTSYGSFTTDLKDDSIKIIGQVIWHARRLY